MVDPFEFLGVGYDADTAQMRTAFRQRARDLHPDTGGDTNQFVTLQDAYNRAMAIRDGQRASLAEESVAGVPGEPEPAVEDRPKPSAAVSEDAELQGLRPWALPWLLLTLVIQVTALSIVVVGQPSRPGWALVAAWLLGPTTATAVFLAAVLVGERRDLPHRLTRTADKLLHPGR